MAKIAIIGTTSWGNSLAVTLAKNRQDIKLWARTKEEALRVRREGPDASISPTISFPKNVTITSSLEEAMDGVNAVLLVVPSQSMRHNIKLVAKYLKSSTLIVSAAKGLEMGTSKRMSEVIADEIKPDFRSNICVLSGPNLAREVLRGLPAASVAAAENENTAQETQKLLTTPRFCIYNNTDVIGVELGGSLKNIIALGAGMADGLGYGDNAKSALITRGLTEITALGVALGANPLTFSGLAGLGDLVTTCASPLSRNHYVGFELAKGRHLNDITSSMDAIAEGVSTTYVVWHLAKKKGLEMPITKAIYQVLYDGADIHKEARELMLAGAAHELAGRKWKLFSFLRNRKKVKLPT